MSAQVPQDPGAERPPTFSAPDPVEVRRLVAFHGQWPLVDRRFMPDRRQGPTKLLSRFALMGKRARGRRRGENRNIYVDRYERADLVGVSSVLILNILDAWLTLVYLGYGGAEANPVARWLLERGVAWFIGAKCLVVSACLVLLACHKTFVLVRPAIRLLLVFYGLLLAYHVFLQADAAFRGLT